MTERIRLTISVTLETHEVFTRLAGVTGHSLGRVMGDWLNDTCQAAGHMVGRFQEVRDMPTLATEIFLAEVAKGAVRVQASPRPFPPSSNTGGKSPSKGR